MTEERRKDEKHPGHPLEWDDTETLAGQESKAPVAVQQATDERDMLIARIVRDSICWVFDAAPQVKARIDDEYLAGIIAKRVPATSPAPAQQTDEARDAARYRWLRDQKGIEGDLPTDGDVWVVQFHQPRGVIPELRCAGFGDKLDRAVDAAMGSPAQQTERQEAEELVRYCPSCGSIGEVEARYRDCCPDGSDARHIPRSLAEKCRETFKFAISAVGAQMRPMSEVERKQAAKTSDWCPHCGQGWDVAEQLVAARLAAPSPAGESVDTPAFRAIPRGVTGPDYDVWPQLIAHIDQHTAQAVKAAEDRGWKAGLADARAEIRSLQDNLETFGPNSEEVARIALDGALDAIDELRTPAAAGTDAGVK